MTEPVEVRSRIIGQEDESREDGLVTSSVHHDRVHEGRTFFISHYFGEIANSGTISMLMRTGSEFVYAIGTVNCGGNALVYLYEDTVPSDNGTQGEPLNMNRNSSNAAETECYVSPTVPGGSEGLQLLVDLLPGGEGPLAGGGTYRPDTEWVLKPASVYYIMATNISGNTQPMHAGVQFSE